MSDSKKITEEELQKLQGVVNAITQGKAALGDIHTQAYHAQLQLVEIEKQVQEVQKELEDKYGAVNININTGEYVEIEKDNETKST